MRKNTDDRMKGYQQQSALRRNRIHEQDSENMKPATDAKQAVDNGASRQVTCASKLRRFGRRSEILKTQRTWSGGSERGGGVLGRGSA